MNISNGPADRTLPVRLRPYQQEAVEELQNRLDADVKRIVIVSFMGSGKTSIAAHIIAEAVNKGSRVLFMAHRRELINQAYNRLLQFGLPEEQLGILMGNDKRRRPGAKVQVASVDTLRNRAKPLADIVFLDECHRVLSKTNQDIAAHYDKAIHLGLTATPFRANGIGLGDAYDDLLQVSSPRQLIEEGYLVEPRVFTVPTGELPDFSRVRIKQGDYDQRALSEAVDSKKLVGNLVEHWMRHANGVRSIAFAVSVAHSKHIAEEFRNAGIAAEHLDGGTPKDERDAILERLEAGETRVVSNVNVCAEGVDIPPAKCVILARPTRSAGLYLQQAGRILRPWNGQQAIILDHGGCVLEHGLPHEDRVYTLDGVQKKRTEGSELPVKICSSCSAVLPLNTRVCPECDTVLIEKPEVPKTSEGDLVEVRSEDLRQIELAKLWRIANSRGYKPGWVYYRYLEKFGDTPPKSPYQKNGRKQNQIDTNSLRLVLHKAAQSQGRLDWSCVDTALRSAKIS